MDPLTLSAIMAGGGLLKGEFIDKPKEAQDVWLAAQTQRYSPWTGLRAGAINRADPFGSAMQGGVQGYSLGQNIESAGAAQELNKLRADQLRAQMAQQSGVGAAPTKLNYAQQEQMMPPMARRQDYSAWLAQ